jgi:hypothetical protein
VKSEHSILSIVPTLCSSIVIDGDPGSGKTTLAGEIANELGFRVVAFDDDKYLPRDGRPYLEQLNYEALRNDIMASSTGIIIEGICALKVLAAINARHDFHIFIKRYNGFLGWDFERFLGEKTKPPHDKLWQEIVEYYKEFKPFEVCKLVLARDILSGDPCSQIETH